MASFDSFSLRLLSLDNFRRALRNIFEGVRVDRRGMNHFRDILNTRGPREGIVIVPSHRSYCDFLLLSYVLFDSGLPLPLIAATEDFLGIPVVTQLFRSAGGFFIRRGSNEENSRDPLYDAVVAAYVQQSLVDNVPVEGKLHANYIRSQCQQFLPQRD